MSGCINSSRHFAKQALFTCCCCGPDEGKVHNSMSTVSFHSSMIARPTLPETCTSSLLGTTRSQRHLSTIRTLRCPQASPWKTPSLQTGKARKPKHTSKDTKHPLALQPLLQTLNKSQGCSRVRDQRHTRRTGSQMPKEEICPGFSGGKVCNTVWVSAGLLSDSSCYRSGCPAQLLHIGIL